MENENHCITVPHGNQYILRFGCCPNLDLTLKKKKRKCRNSQIDSPKIFMNVAIYMTSIRSQNLQVARRMGKGSHMLLISDSFSCCKWAKWTMDAKQRAPSRQEKTTCLNPYRGRPHTTENLAIIFRKLSRTLWELSGVRHHSCWRTFRFLELHTLWLKPLKLMHFQFFYRANVVRKCHAALARCPSATKLATVLSISLVKPAAMLLYLVCSVSWQQKFSIPLFS